jgi:PAS domain S-box-containing protein
MSKKLKEQIEDLEKQNRVIADNLIDAIWTLDVKTLTFDYITPSIEKISGYTADEYIECPIQDRLTPDSFQKVAAIIAEEIPKFEKGIKTVRTTEVELIHKTGNIYWVEIRARLINETGKLLKIIGVTRDITDRKKVEQKQNELIEKLGKTLREKEKLLKEKEKLLRENKILKELLPICSGCKRIRDENGKWWPFDAYVAKMAGTEITHTICSDCKAVFYPEL